MLNISTREREWGEVIAVADREPDVWASVGIHPHEADAHADMDTARLVDAADHPRVVAIGETGLDYSYEHSERHRQQISFRDHIAPHRETRLPPIVNTPRQAGETHHI